MLDIKFLEESGFFKELFLKDNERVFDEGERNDNLYIITDGECKIEKYTNSKRDEKKIIAFLKKGDFVGEASVSSWNKKQAIFTSIGETRVIYIDAKIGIKELVSKYPHKGLELLKYIILVTNSRLSKSNSLLVATNEISKFISEIKQVNNKSLFMLIDKINSRIQGGYIQYIEANQLVENYVTLRYDSRERGVLKDTIIQINNDLTVEDLKVNCGSLGRFIYIGKLRLGSFNLGYIVIGRESKEFTKDDKQLISTIGLSLSGFIRQKLIIEENKNLKFLHDSEDN